MKTLLTTACLLIVLSLTAQHQIGHLTKTFVDATRGNRSIETEIYYPATTAGNNTTAVQNQFPVIVFGHGFVMAWDAYENIWEELVPKGYILVFPRTEGSLISTDHQKFGWDLQFLVTEIQAEGVLNSSILYNVVHPNTALMGHSMGGGASFLAADSLCTNGNLNLKTLVGLAPAESTTNGVSSIASAANVTVPSLILSGIQDGVTPPNDHHIPMYNALASSCKTILHVIGGAHCYFANSSFTCDFGESTSSSGISITREEQHEVFNDFVSPWLEYTLKSTCGSFQQFQDSVANSSRVSYDQSCSISIPPLSLTADFQTNISCNAGSNGVASVNIATGGSGTYTYDWTPGNPTGDGTTNVSGLTAGVWTCTVTDASGCSTSQDFTITEPSVLTLTSASQTNVLCNGGSNGVASVNVATGGTSGYTYDWTPGNPSGDATTSITGLTAGTWDCIVTDALGCTKTVSFVITEPLTPVDASFSYASLNYCPTESDPSPTINGALGGTFTSGTGLSIDPSSGVIDLSASTPGSYTVTYSTNGACSNSSNQNVTITSNGAPIADVTTLSDVTSQCEITSLTAPTATDNCSGSVSGTHNVTLPITVQGTTVVTWTYTGAGGSTSTQLQNVIITGFDVTASLVDDLTITSDILGDSYQWVDCNDGNSLLNGEESQVLSVLSNGSYAVIVTNGLCKDTSNCIIIDKVGLTEVESIKLSVYPNPSNTGMFNINYNGEIHSVELIDMLGRKILTVTSGDLKTIEVNDIELGKYFLRIITDKGAITKDVVIVR